MNALHWLRLAVAAVVASELFLRLPLLAEIRRATGTASKAQALLKSKRISDNWKERMLPYYALVIGRSSVFFFLLLCLALVPVVLIGLTHPGGVVSWLAALMQPLNLIGLCVLSVGYMVVRSRFTRG